MARPADESRACFEHGSCRTGDAPGGVSYCVVAELLDEADGV
jgi:hypothetical protein